MNGIETITGRIQADAKAEIETVNAQAQAQAAAILADYEAKAKTQADAIVARGKQNAQRREERLAAVAALEGRKATLAAKQEMVTKAFDQAVDKLCDLPEEDYVNLLAALAVKAATTGREAVVLSQKDRARVGKAVVMAANEILAKNVTPKLPEDLSDTRTGAFLEKVVTGASALLARTGMLTLSEKTAPIRGGLILADGAVEVNCSFEMLVRLARNDLAGQVANLLFE